MIKSLQERMERGSDFIKKYEQEKNQYKWQPIETAPKDGTVILVINGEEEGHYTSSFQIGTASWDRSYSGYYWLSNACCDGVSYYIPTHWMPLPNPPQQQLEVK